MFAMTTTKRTGTAIRRTTIERLKLSRTIEKAERRHKGEGWRGKRMKRRKLDEDKDDDDDQELQTQVAFSPSIAFIQPRPLSPLCATSQFPAFCLLL